MVQGVEIDPAGNLVNTNPATGSVISRVPTSSPDDVSDAVARARSAQIGWSAVPLAERIALLKTACDKFADVKDDLAAKITEEMGKPIVESEGEVGEMFDRDDFMDLIEKANRDEVLGGDDDEGGSKSVVVRDPLGVVAVLSPWNFPAGEIPLLALPALAAGNAVIVKPSEVAPECGAMVVKVFASVLPDGVIQILQGDGAVGKLLVDSPGVDMVAMTGSSATGKKIMEGCAPGLKRLVLELGGKDPMLVFGDADLDAAAKDAVQFSLFNTGQVCCAVERVYVDESVKEEFERKVVEASGEWKVGEGTERANKVGPMVSTVQRDHVAGQVKGAVEAGARVLYTGDVPAAGDSSAEGNYHPVTVLADLTQDMAIQRAETFGPVVALSTFDGTEEEGVRLANDTEYGLAGYVYTSDLDKAERVARRMRCGQVGINCYSIFHAHVACPWVGHKSSGFGYHSGPDGFRQFSVPKSLVFKG